MMRPFAVLCLLLAIGSGLYLYRVKYASTLLDREITVTLKAADDARARAAMLRADYALLNDPIRLQELADLHLGIKTTQPGQFTTMAEFERRLPPVGPPMGAPEVPAEAEVPVALRRAEPDAARPAEAPRPAPVVAAIPPRIVAPTPPPTPTVPSALPLPMMPPPMMPPSAQAAAAPRVMPVAPPQVIAAGPRAPTPLAPPGPALQVAIGAAPGPAVIRAAPPPAPSGAPSPAVAPRPAPPRAPAPPAALAPPLATPPLAAPPLAAPPLAAPVAEPAAPRSALGMARRPLGPIGASLANGGGAN
jgi:hypothetical protein